MPEKLNPLPANDLMEDDVRLTVPVPVAEKLTAPKLTPFVPATVQVPEPKETDAVSPLFASKPDDAPVSVTLYMLASKLPCVNVNVPAAELLELNAS